MPGKINCTSSAPTTLRPDAHLLIVEFKEPPMEGEAPGIWWED